MSSTENKNSGASGVAKKIGHAISSVTGGVANSAGGTVGVAGAGLSDKYNTTDEPPRDADGNVIPSVADTDPNAAKKIEQIGQPKAL